MLNDHAVFPLDNLPDTNRDIGARISAGTGSNPVIAPGPRIPVYLWAKDPISLGGLTSALRFRPEFELLVADDCDRAQVSVIATESLDTTAVSQLRGIKARSSGRTVLVVNTLVDDDMLTAVDAGVCAVVWRWEATSSWLGEVVVKAAAGEAALPSDVLSRLLKQIERLNRHVLAPRGIGLGGLSGREIEVLRLAADGLDTEEIAVKLAYSARTVTSTLHDVMHRFQLKNRTQAVAYAIREGLI
jgi:DNA-binding NarL/FixJ family response regulator